MPYYVQPQYTHQNYNNFNNYSQHQDWDRNNWNHNWNNGRYHNNWYNHGNGYTAMQHAHNWYPGWNAYNWRWDNDRDCYRVYLRNNRTPTVYITVYVSGNYGFQGYQNGYNW